MPLYMDFHNFSEISIDEVKKAHIADKSVQDKYGVKYHQFWVNENAGTVFCLMEGPDKESCSEVHREAHGNVACEIVEVESGFYDLFLKNHQKIDHGLVKHQDGSLDTGIRFILAIDIIGSTNITKSIDYKSLKLPSKPKKLVLDCVGKFHGKQIKYIANDSFLAVFDDADKSLQCAIEIQSKLTKKSRDFKEGPEWNISFKMGLNCGQPVTENDSFFEKAITLAQRLKLSAENKKIVVSASVKMLSDFDTICSQQACAKIMTIAEEKFLDDLFDITHKKMADSDFNIENLSRKIGISRPQLYRKITSITGRSPNRFIRDIKMQKALSLICAKELNISEIALELGYTNPSYFSKRFHEKYGVAPSQVIG